MPLETTVMIRSNPYEAAFEAYLRDQGVGVLPVDESRRAMLNQGLVKSLDFVVLGQGDVRLVVDVKGRRFPGGAKERPRKVWQNWTTHADLDGLQCWAEQFGSGFQPVLAFVYRIEKPYCLPDNTPDLYPFRGETYLMRGVPCQAYRDHMRCRSPRWGTVHLGSADFRQIIRPFREFLLPLTSSLTLP
jgi:hypothetical protein